MPQAFCFALSVAVLYRRTNPYPLDCGLLVEFSAFLCKPMREPLLGFSPQFGLLACLFLLLGVLSTFRESRSKYRELLLARDERPSSID